MILRIDKLLTELPIPSNPSPEGAAAVQEVMGGKTGELSTLMNYLFQSSNFRGRDAYREALLPTARGAGADAHQVLFIPELPPLERLKITIGLRVTPANEFQTREATARQRI